MTPSYFCLDGDVANGVNPFRPGVDTIGGVDKVDDMQYPPDSDEHFTAADFNQRGNLVVGLARVAPLARLYVKFSGGTPSVFMLVTIGTLLVASDFGLTDNGPGDTTVTCLTSKIPLPMFGFVMPQTTVDIRATCLATANSIRVITRNAGSSAVDCDFALDWC